MDRRVLLLTVALAACGGGRSSPPSASAAPATADAGPARARNPAPVAALAPDAAPEPEPAGESIQKANVLEGAAAETAIAQRARDAGPAGVPDDLPGLRPDGAANLRLDMTRAEVATAIQGRGLLRRQPTEPGQVTVETAVVTERGAPLLRLRVEAGRLVEIEVLTRHPRTVTEEGIGVGSSFEEAIAAHGDARRVTDERTGRPRGWVLQGLPGVLFVPADRNAVTADEPPPTARIGRVLVLGPEALAAND